MKAEGRISLDAPREHVYARLSDPRTLKDVVDTVQSVELEGEDAFTVVMAPSTGLGVTPLQVHLQVLERRENEHVRLHGEADGGEFRSTFQVEVDFASDGEGSEVGWSAQARIDGVLGSLGQRVLPAILSAQVERVIRAAAAGVGTASS